jgi:hypothetical protein
LKLEKRNEIRITRKGGKSMEMNEEMMKNLHWAHCMTTRVQFGQAFEECGEYHLNGYITEQWNLWLDKPLMFIWKWLSYGIPQKIVSNYMNNKQQ